MDGPASRVTMARTWAGEFRQALRRMRGEGGQALVEFAIVLLPLLLVLFGAIEFGRAWNTKNMAVHLANEAARMAAVNQVICTGTSPVGLRNEAASDGLPASTTITITTGQVSPQQPVTATVTVPFSSSIPLIGSIFSAAGLTSLTGTATMRTEIAYAGGSC
jgi:Flp pilus assembly protein TadG